MQEPAEFKEGTGVFVRRVDYGPDGAVQNTIARGIIQQRGSSFCRVKGRCEESDQDIWFDEWLPINSRRLYLIPA